MSSRGRGRGHSRGSRVDNGGRGSGRTSSRSRNNNGSNDDNDHKTEKVEFTPHCAGKTQGATCDTVKKQIIHDIRGKCKCGNNLAELIENEIKHKTKEALCQHFKFDWVTFNDKSKPTELELLDCEEFVKEKTNNSECTKTTRRKPTL